MNYEEKIKFIFLKKVLDDLSEERVKGFHVSELVYDCLREMFFNIVLREELYGEDEVRGLDEESILTLWIGKKLHELSISENHEKSIRVGDVVGKMDEMIEIGNNKIIIDKKTTKQLPNKPFEHHIKQVEYYSALLWSSEGVDVRYGCVLYIDVNNKKVKAYVFEIKRDKMLILKEIMDKVSKLKEYMNKRKIPPPDVSWKCNFCRWFERCVRAGVDEVEYDNSRRS